MKIIVIGDLHGLDVWKRIVDQEADRIIFLGDYLDSFHVPGIEQLENLKDVVEFKKNNMDKVVLLWGNHDHHYRDMGERYSGFQKGMQYQFGPVLEENKELFQICHEEGKYLFSHAGVTITWCDANHVHPGKGCVGIINDLYRYRPKCFNFSGHDDYGDDVTQGPLWVRPGSLSKDKIEDYVQVVGHTVVKNLVVSQAFFVDCLETSGEYLVITDGIANIKKLEYEAKN